jgi:hypothetical protein
VRRFSVGPCGCTEVKSLYCHCGHCLTAAGLLGYRFFGMDAYGNLESMSASLCTNYLSVVFNMFEKYATADPAQYTAGVRTFARMLEFLCQSSSSDGCRGTFWVRSLTQLCLPRFHKRYCR